jgi:hypothetical protein
MNEKIRGTSSGVAVLTFIDMTFTIQNDFSNSLLRV